TTAGERVVGVVRRGAWAELVAAPTSQLATIPDGVSDADAATLPTAGLTALRSLELGGLLLGRGVLVVAAVGGATFAAASEPLAPGGLVVNLATGSAEEVVSFRAARFDRSPGARIYTLNLFEELPRMAASESLARLAALLAERKLSAGVEL